MMRAIYIICEGESEEEFINNLLRPYFNTHKIYDVYPILMSTSKVQKGGDIKYDRLKFNVEKLLSRESDVLVTSFIDFYKLKTDFPQYTEAQQIQNKIHRVEFLEKAMCEAMNFQRFIPYIQLHEFEGLLFASKDGFESLTDLKAKNIEALLLAVEEKENPEELNDGVLTAPSKRLGQLIPGFDKDKPLYGGFIAEVNTIYPILKRCTRFNHWVETLIQKFKE